MIALHSHAPALAPAPIPALALSAPTTTTTDSDNGSHTCVDPTLADASARSTAHKNGTLSPSSLFRVFTALVLVLVASWIIPNAAADTVKFDLAPTSVIHDGSHTCVDPAFVDVAHQCVVDMPSGVDPTWMIDQ